MADRVELTCPCCSTKLVVDSGNGEILSEERPKLDAEKTFNSAMDQVPSFAALGCTFLSEAGIGAMSI